MPGSLLCGFPQLFPEVPRETHQKETENANAKTGEWTWRNFLALRQLGRPRCTPGIGDLLKGGLHQPKVRPPSLSHNALEVKGSTLPSLLPPLAYSCSLQRKQLSEAAPTRQCRRGRQEVSPQEFRAWLGWEKPWDADTAVGLRGLHSCEYHPGRGHSVRAWRGGLSSYPGRHPGDKVKILVTHSSVWVWFSTPTGSSDASWMSYHSAQL